MPEELQAVVIRVADTAMSEPMSDFVREGLRRGKNVDCFEFVSSNSDVLHATLSAQDRGRYCEWGSGMGIGVGIAEMLGYRAVGIEIDAPLAAASRQLLSDFGLVSEILTGDFYEISCEADLYFVYGWPSQMRTVRPYFASLNRTNAKLLVGHGADDIRGEMLIRH